MTTYRSPLCLDIIDSSEFTNQTWVKCSCGHWFTEDTLHEFAQSREKLSAAQKRFADIREQAKQQSIDRAIEVSSFGFTAGVPASVPAVTSVPAPIASPQDEVPFQPAPYLVREPAPQRTRNLPTLSTSQWLLTVMAGLIAVALTIFFSVTWNDLPAIAKVGVVGLLTVGFSFGATKAKKYFVGLANVLAIIASATTFIGLQSLSRYEILPRAWSDSQNTPFVSIMLAIVTAGSLLMGRRFKIWGWLIIAPIGTALSAILFTYNYIGQLLGDGYNHAGYQIAMLSAAVLGVVTVARYTRLEAPLVPELAKAKKDQTDELKQEIVDAEYQLSLHNREQASLSLASRFSIFAILGYLAFLAGSIATQLFPFTMNIAGQDFLGVDPVGLIIAALFWITGASLLNRFGPAFTSNGEISVPLAKFIWVTAFSTIAFAVSYSALWIANQGLFAVLLVGALLGSVMIFAQSFIGKISSDEAAKLGALVGSIVLWSISLIIWIFANSLWNSQEFVIFTTIVSVALLVRSVVFASVRTAQFSSSIYSIGLLAFILDASLVGNIFLNFALSLGAVGIWTVTLTLLRERIGLSANFISTLQTAGVGLFTVIALGRELPNVLPTDEALGLLALLLVLAGFGFAFMILALLPALRAIENLRKTLAYSSFILLGAGLVSLVALAESSGMLISNFYPVANTYVLLVVLILAVYGTIAKRHIALQVGLVLGAVLAAGMQQWSFEWFSNFATPAISLLFLGSALLAFSRLAMRLGETLSKFNTVFYPVSFAALSGIYLLSEASRDLNLTNFSFAVFVAFGVFHFLVASGKIMTISQESKKSFDGVALVALVMTTVQSIAIIDSQSLIRLAVLSLISGALLSIVKRSAIRELDVWLLSSVLAQIAIIGQLSDSQLRTLWVLELPAISILLSGLHYIAAREGIRKSTGNSEFTFAPRLLPTRILAVSIAGLLAPVVINVYSNLNLDNTASIALPATILSYLLVSALFVIRRWSKHIIADADSAIERTVPIIWGVGFVSLIQANNETGSLTLDQVSNLGFWFAAYLAGISALSYITAIFKKSSIQTFTGYGAALVASFLFAFELILNNKEIQLALLFLILAIGLFVLTTFVLRKIGHSFTEIGFPLMLPASIVLAFVFSLEFGNSGSNSTQSWVEIVVALAIGVVALFMSRGSVLGNARLTGVPMLLSAILLYAVANWYAGVGFESDDAQAKAALVAITLFGALSVFIRKFKAPIAVYLSLAAAGQLGITIGLLSTSLSATVFDYESDIIVLISAVAVATVTPKLAELHSDRWRTLIRHGLPLAIFLAPGIFTVYSVIGSNFYEVQQFKFVEAIALLAITSILLVVGVRIGNLGVSSVSGVFLAVTVLPILWHSVSQIGDSQTRFEVQALYAGLLVAGSISGLRTVLKLEMNSILYVGAPSLIALMPTVFGVVGKFGSNATEATAADWTRLAIVLVASAIFLLLGSVRRLAGFFVPGGVALIVTVIPLLWTRMTSLGSAFIVIGLLLLAALIGFVAVRLEQVKGTAKNASKWLRELR